MRLTCPNCGAQYEVPDGVIPVAGRDVQCSNCGHTWFQHHPDDAAAEADDLAPVEPDLTEADDAETDAPAGPADGARQRRQLDPSIAELLREEAEREARAREAERGAGLESQPDLGLTEPEDESARRARQARERMARMRGEPDHPEDEPGPEEGAASRRDLLPDIDEINSSLRAASDRRPAEADDHQSPGAAEPVPAKPRGGFRRGFLLALLLAALLLLLYANAGPIAAKVPALQPLLDAYVAVIDQARAALDAQVKAWLVKLEAAGSV